MRAIHLTAFGDPAQGLEFVQIQEPAAPSAGQALIGVEFSPIDLSDLLVVSGSYPFRPSLPSVIGNEGVGRILAVGPGVDNVAVGDRVLTPLYGLAWAERIVVPAQGLFALPADVDPQQLAMLTINPPTAGLLLSEFVDLAPGDWVVQNAANSGVGRAVIAFAKARGFKTINLVRRTELIDELKALGGDLVIVDAPEGLNLAKDALAAAAPRLALDGVGGPSAATLISLLGRDGTLVAYAALGKAPIVVSAMALIFKRISVRGFFLSDPEHAAKIAPLIVEAAEFLRSGRLHAPVAATYPLSAIKDAVAHVQRGGKVLLDVAHDAPTRRPIHSGPETDMPKTTSEQNKVLVLEAFDTLFNKRDYAAAERFWSTCYIQHSAHIGPGREGLFDLVRSAPAALRYENQLIVAEGDFVIAHGRFSGNGRPAAWIAADVVRIEDGKLAEHWDVLQDEATKAESVSGLPMFGDHFPA
jgi:NADPH:quinone reductase-like Zn-dependent oxidoreductase/predicted SnoaL-like aldol condensation-catalyzing enzyme